MPCDTGRPADAARMPENPRNDGPAPGTSGAFVYLAAICGAPLLVSLLVAVFSSAGDAVRSSEPAKPSQALTPAKNPAPNSAVTAESFLPDDPKWGALKLALIEWMGAHPTDPENDLLKDESITVHADSIHIGHWIYGRLDINGNPVGPYHLYTVSRGAVATSGWGFLNVRYVDGKWVFEEEGMVFEGIRSRSRR